MIIKLKFSGQKGTFMNPNSFENDGLGKYEYSPNDGKPIYFKVLDGHTFTLTTIYLFNNAKPHK